MSTLIRKPQHTVVIFGIFLLTMGALLVVSQVASSRYINNTRRLVSLMNDARQQALTTQRLWNGVAIDPTEGLAQDTLWSYWEDQHDTLLNASFIPFAEFNFVRSRSHLLQSYDQIQNLRASADSSNYPNVSAHLQEYTHLMEQYGNSVEMHVQAKASRLQNMKIFFVLLVMLVIVVQVFFIFYPAYRRERKARKSLGEVNLSLQQHIEELQTREEELSQNLEEITALQDQLVTSENRYRNLVESSQDIIYELGDTGNFSYINPTFTEVLGYSREEAYKTGYWEYIRADHREHAVHFYYEQIKNVQPNSYLEVPILTKTGEVRWLGQNVQIEFQGDWVQRVFAIARDITELKQVQEQLAESEQRYRLLSENARDLVSLHSADGVVQYISNSSQELLGYAPEALVGTKFQVLIYHEDLERLRNSHQSDSSRLAKSHNTTYRVRRSDGRYIWLETITKPILNEQGELEYLQTASRDITSRVEVEAQLRRQKEMLSEAQRIAKMASWEYDRSQRRFFVSEELEAILPGMYRPDGLPLDVYRRHIHPEDVEYQAEAFKRALDEGIPYNLEVRHLLPDGSDRTLSFRAQPQLNAQGKVERILGSMQDITEAKRQRDLLKREQDQLVAFINAAPAAMAMFDRKLRYITASQRWLEDFGLENVEVMGQGHYDLLPRWNPVWRNNIDECLKENNESGVKRPFKTIIEGKEEWVRWECRPWYDMEGKVGGNIMYAELITEQLREEREQQVQQLRMQTIYRIVSQVSGDLKEQVSDVLSIATEELGMELGMITRLEKEENVFVIEDLYAPGERMKVGDQFPFHETYCGITYRLDSIVAIDNVKDSEYRNEACYQQNDWESYLGVSLYVKGERYGTLGFMASDPVQKPFRQIDKDYVQLVGQWIAAALERAEFEDEIISSKEKAEAATEAKAQFLSMMSHEIRTPLNAVIGMSHLLLQEDPREDQLENLKTLRFSGENLLVLINDILDFSKIEAGKISLENVPFSLKDIAQGIHNSLGYRAVEKGIEFKLEVDSAIPNHLMGDPVRISQILTNLVSNAVKFTEKGHVTLRIRVTDIEAERVALRFVVADTGIGIPGEKMETIFESFTQARSDTTRRYGGTGLGLAITKRLLELMNSEIVLESEEGEGSTFSFVTTMKVANRAASQELDMDLKEEGLEGSLQNVRLLLVEDNPVNQLVATKFLKRWKISSDIAKNGLEAVEMIKSQRYHVVLMDLQMPEMDGYEASRTIRSMEASYFREVPIIALTASAMQDVRNKVMASGMTDFVTKPFNPVELYRKIVQYAQENSSVSQ